MRGVQASSLPGFRGAERGGFPEIAMPSRNPLDDPGVRRWKPVTVRHVGDPSTASLFVAGMDVDTGDRLMTT